MLPSLTPLTVLHESPPSAVSAHVGAVLELAEKLASPSLRQVRYDAYTKRFEVIGAFRHHHGVRSNQEVS